MFNFKTDIKVELYAGITNTFIIGISQINGTDLIAASSYQYVDVTQYASEINIHTGITFDSALGRPDEPDVTVTIKGDAYDPRINPSIHVGNPIKISAKDVSGTWRIIYHGRIRNISTKYNPETTSTADKNLVTFMMDSPLSIANQSTIQDLTLPNDQYATDRMAALVAAASVNNVYFPEFSIRNDATSIVTSAQMGSRTVYGETFGDAFQECFDAQGGRGWMALDYQSTNPNGVLCYKTRNRKFPAPAGYYLPLDNQGIGIQISNIDLSSDSNEITNSFNVSYTWNTADVYKRVDQDSIDLHGEKSLDISLNLTTTYDDRPGWVDFAQYYGKKDRIRQVTASPINVTDKNINELAFIQAGLKYANLNFVQGNMNINNNYLISKVAHSITPETWVTDLELLGV